MVKNAPKTRPTPNLHSPEGRPWLLSDYDEPVWTVADANDRTRRAKIDFRFPLCDGRPLCDVPPLLRTVKQYAVWVRTPEYGGFDSARHHSSSVRSLMWWAHALSLRGIWSFADATRHDFEEIASLAVSGVAAMVQAERRALDWLANLCPEAELPTPHQLVAECSLPRLAGIVSLLRDILDARRRGTEYKVRERSPVSVQAVFRTIKPVEALYEMLLVMEGDRVSFPPFEGGAMAFANLHGAGTTPTPVPPPPVLLGLLSYACLWVALDGAALVEQLKASPSTPHFSTRQTPERQQQMYPIEDAVRHLSAACFAVLAAFTAARASAIEELREDALQGSDRDGWYLEIYIAKTLRQHRAVPVPHVVARAVDILLDLSASAREAGSKSVFQWSAPPSLGPRLHRPTKPRAHLPSFAAQCEAVYREGEPWPFRPHQFRRAFAVLYFYRYEGGTIEALAHHLGHVDYEMTRKYLVADQGLSEVFNAEEQAYARRLIRSITDGTRKVGGGMGKHIAKFAERLTRHFRRHLQVIDGSDAERLDAAMEAFVRRKGLVIRPMPWSTCTCPATAAAASKARCRHGEDAAGVGPNKENACPERCATCVWAITSPDNRHVAEEISHLSVATRADIRRDTVVGRIERDRLAELVACYPPQEGRL